VLRPTIEITENILNAGHPSDIVNRDHVGKVTASL
jgi:hypothetical protein